MRDGFESRYWAEHHDAFSTGVAGLFAKALTAFERLNAIQFDAPWRRHDRGA